MNHLPKVGIILITYERTDYAVETVGSVCANLRYDGEFGWYIADDGSRSEHVAAIQTAIRTGGHELWDMHQLRTPQEKGYGASANKAWKTLAEDHDAPITLWLEDDWRLNRPLDITPYVKALHQSHVDVGMIRLGHMPQALDLTTLGYDGRMYGNVKKTQQYAYSGNPHLKHVSYMASYGLMPTNENPGNTEIHYDHIFRTTSGVQIWWPFAIGDKPYFDHIGEVQSYVY